MPNYQFVIDSSFRPFSFGEMLQPWTIYSNAYEKVEDTYNEYMKKADTFKYLADETADDPKAKAIYESYANDLRAQAADLAKNGLSIANRRALTSLKQRYQGEIGQLEIADEQLKELMKGRNALAAAGKTMLYNNDNPKLSDFLGGGRNFNRYAIDAADLRTRGNALGKAISSREYSNDEAGNILQGQYKLWRQTHGVRDIASFMQSDAVQQAVDNELIANGAASNLTGRNLDIARQNILNGIYEGIVYEESMKPLENGEYLSAKEKASLAQSADATALNAALYGYKKNAAGQWVPDPTLQNVKGRSSSSSSSSNSGGSRSGGKVPAYSDIQYISRQGSTAEVVDGISSNARKVNVEIQDGKYVITAGAGKDKFVLGSIDGSGAFEIGKDIKNKFGDYFGPASKSLYGLLQPSYDPDEDNGNIEALARDILEIANREGAQGYKNYNFYIESDNSGSYNNAGGFYREPLKREYGTTANGIAEEENEYDESYGE